MSSFVSDDVAKSCAYGDEALSRIACGVVYVRCRCDVRVGDASARLFLFRRGGGSERATPRSLGGSRRARVENSPGGLGGRAVDAGADRRSRACLELRETRAGSSRSRPASPSCRPTSRVVEWVGTREKKPRVASYLALRYVLRVRGERPEHAFRVRALVRVMAVVHHVAQLLELPERLRHGASPESRHRRRRKPKRCTSTKRGSRSDPGGAIAACARASVRPRRCAVAALDSRRRVPTTPTRTPRRSAAVPTVWRASGSAQTLSQCFGLSVLSPCAAFRGSDASDDERAGVGV